MQMRSLLVASTGLLTLMLMGCAAHASRLMDYESCAASRVCTIRGTATAKIGEHAPTVEVAVNQGRCVNVSLPQKRWQKLRRSGPKEMTVTGTVYHEPSNEEGE